MQKACFAFLIKSLLSAKMVLIFFYDILFQVIKKDKILPGLKISRKDPVWKNKGRDFFISNRKVLLLYLVKQKN